MSAAEKIAQDAVLAAKAAFVGNDTATARDLLDDAMGALASETWGKVADEAATDAILARVQAARHIAADVTVAVIEALRQRERNKDLEYKGSQVDSLVVTVFEEVLGHRREKIAISRIQRVDSWSTYELIRGEYTHVNFGRFDYGDDPALLRLWTGMHVVVPPGTVGGSICLTDDSTGRRSYHPLWAFSGKTHAPLWLMVLPHTQTHFEIQALNTAAVAAHPAPKVSLYVTGWSYRP